MTNTRKINVPEIPSTEYWETHNKSGTNKPFGECEHPDTAASRILPGSLRGRSFSFKIMTKEMYENFVKQEKKFATLTGQVFDSLEEAGIDLDGDIIIVDGQKYAVDVESWYLRGK